MSFQLQASSRRKCVQANRRQLSLRLRPLLPRKQVTPRWEDAATVLWFGRSTVCARFPPPNRPIDRTSNLMSAKQRLIHRLNRKRSRSICHRQASTIKTSQIKTTTRSSDRMTSQLNYLEWHETAGRTKWKRNMMLMTILRSRRLPSAFPPTKTKTDVQPKPTWSSKWYTHNQVNCFLVLSILIS